MRRLFSVVAAFATVLCLSAVAGAAQAGTTTTTTTLTSSVNPSNIGQTTTLTAAVTAQSLGAICAGTVAFQDGGSALTCTGGSQTVASNHATCQVAFGASGPHTLTAVYTTSNNTGCLSSTSANFTQTVNAASAVPTLAGWAAYLLTALLLGGGLWFMARRNTASPFTPA